MLWWILYSAVDVRTFAVWTAIILKTSCLNALMGAVSHSSRLQMHMFWTSWPKWGLSVAMKNAKRSFLIRSIEAMSKSANTSQCSAQTSARQGFWEKIQSLMSAHLQKTSAKPATSRLWSLMIASRHWWQSSKLSRLRRPPSKSL